jgi:hypothetical protein
MRSLRLTAAAVVASSCIASAVNAQIPTAPGVQPDSTAFAMELATRSRWMHGRQQARFSPFTSEGTRFYVDSIRTQGDRRRMYLNMGNGWHGVGSALVDIDLARGLVDVSTAVVPRARPFFSAADSLSEQVGLRQQRVLNEVRLWDVFPSFPAAALRVGLTWTDTIAHTVSDGLFRRSIHGTRVSRVVRDTLVGGHRLWVVSDSAAVSYEEINSPQERTLDTTVVESRIATGTVRGVHFIDTDLRLFRWRTDTTRLQGEAVLQYPDGRSFRTPARYEATRRWMLYDPRAYRTYVAERGAASMRQWGGMARVPSNTLEQRLAARDSSLRDSLMQEWRRAPDSDSAQRIFTSLRMWSARDRQSEAALLRMRTDAGDTVFLYEDLANRASAYKGQIDTNDVRVMLGFMSDPSIAWGFNQSRDRLYENLAQTLTTSPPAVAVRNDRIPCTPAACRLLEDQWRTAREPRLRDLGLVALFTSDPRRWGDCPSACRVRQTPYRQPMRRDSHTT